MTEYFKCQLHLLLRNDSNMQRYKDLQNKMKFFERKKLKICINVVIFIVNIKSSHFNRN